MALTPSNRIKIIKNVADRLGGEGWSLIDLTLKQYQLPYSDQWGGSGESYVMKMIEDAPDQSLIDLAVHVGAQTEQKLLRIDPPFWTKGLLKVFITHVSKQKKVAAELQQEIAAYGMSGFVAHHDIEPTREWQGEIEAALATCDCLVALLHADFHLSNWVDQEIGYAMGRGVPVLAVKFQQDPYGFIGRFQAFEGKGKALDILAKEIFDQVRRNKQTEQNITRWLIAELRRSGSFAESKKLVGYLEEVESWEDSYAEELKSAMQENLQVSASWGVPGRIETLIQRHMP